MKLMTLAIAFPMPLVTRALTLEDLPPPPPGKTGWPWTEQTDPLPPLMPDGSEWLRISIVTPSYNQGQFIEETIRSVLLQGYPNLEYLIIDGGSTDNTLEVIRRYEPWIAYWVSERDRGQSHALNKGFARATGELIGWQNSDDFYAPNCFSSGAIASKKYPEAAILYGDVFRIDEPSRKIAASVIQPFDFQYLFPKPLLANQGMLIREQVFKSGYFLDENLHYCMDHEFFWKLAIAKFEFKFEAKIAGYHRFHELAKTLLPNSKSLIEYASCYENLYDTFPAFRKTIKEGVIQTLNSAYLQKDYSLFRKLIVEILRKTGFDVLTARIFFKFLISFLLQTKLLNSFEKT